MIAIGCDHGGYILKQKIMDYYRGLEFKDFGTMSEESVDFPDFAIPVAESVASGECEKGILLCRSGIGMSIAANKVKGIRCALCYSTATAISAKRHNNANVIAVGADELDFEEVKNIIDFWLKEEFLGGKYQLRLDKISEYEERMR
ncbi:MAG: ribose 5-phosphate isomerase B [Clostridia bacterium]|nr:ribose 5-phosphate isomerase B [Clostridia bacterium]